MRQILVYFIMDFILSFDKLFPPFHFESGNFEFLLFDIPLISLSLPQTGRLL